jgi:hypothetical protein
MKYQVLDVLDFFFSFLCAIEKKEGHNILVIMFNPKFKSMHLVSAYMGCENATILVATDDE